jgi:hypothetical protein
VVERRTLASIDAQQLSAMAARRPRSGGVLVFAIAAAALVMLIAGQRGPSPTPAPVVSPVVDVSQLPASRESANALPSYLATAIPQQAAIESGDEPLRFVVPQVASWVLAPGSRAIVKSTGTTNALELERGAIYAEVVPRHDSDAMIEAMIIECGGTRVAVHGTVFSVERIGDRVVVDVTRGIVTVGPAGHRGATTGLLLSSPARAAFSAKDGHLVERYESSEGAQSQPATSSRDSAAQAVPAARDAVAAADALRDEKASADSPQAKDDRPAPSAPRAEAQPEQAKTEEPRESPKAPRRLTLDEARAIMVACLSSDVTSGDPSTRVTVSTQITVQLDGDGNVTTVRFDPPLRPDLQQRCGGALFGRLIEGSGSVSFRILFATR